MNSNLYKNKKILITGGTGSFGNAVIKKLLNFDLEEIIIFSRDEKKQDDMRKKYKCNNLKFFIGDVRDYNSIYTASRGIDYIFHAAALKQVPSCEFYPLEAIKTNVLGAENVLEASINNNVKRVICLSTDKAVYPINVMGLSKSMMEKIAISKSKMSTSTKISVTRYGNVMASRGSVIPLFVEQILSGKEISITDPKMTRFMMSLDDAVDLVFYAFENSENGDIFVQKSPAINIENLAKALLATLKKENINTKIIGTRHGEKLYESLLSREEFSIAIDLGNYYRIPPDLRDLNYENFIDKGELKISESEDYNSNNTKQLSIKEMSELLEKLPYIHKFL